MAHSVDALHPDPIPQVDATPRLSQYLSNVSHPEGIHRTQGRVIEFNEPSSIPQPHTLSQELLQEVPKEPLQPIPPLNIPPEPHAELPGAEALEQQQQPPVPEAAEVQLVPEAEHQDVLVEQQKQIVEQQHQIVEQQNQIDEQQPDFIRLRNEAIQRHISTSASQ
ncbi:putative uncharacterized protein DDB_G0294196 [Lutzomyia longipalpis]|uniref:putative uncharacterized protein DDB_G0294196 n=1 Tax=Lutzomyia longipalpis TaxID=7200 RepID=UPI0024834DCF|nr:putative uncharacterized protein DDB_G0294196 [Lutzomyia longipalpis]